MTAYSLLLFTAMMAAPIEDMDENLRATVIEQVSE